MIRYEWRYGEYRDFVMDKAIILLALRLAFVRKHPFICRRMRFAPMLCSAWYELIAFISDKRGKFYTDFAERALRKFGRKEIRM